MKKKSKKKVVWLDVDHAGYEIRKRKPMWSGDVWCGNFRERRFCTEVFERLFPFFKMPPNSLGKITNTANTLTFEIVETKCWTT